MKNLFVIAIAVLAIGLFGSGAQASTGRTVILLHGWNGNASSWNTAKAAYQAHGDIVYVLSLPDAGWGAGSTDHANADYVESFIASNHLTNVQLDGHSLGGWLALDIVLLRHDPAVTSVVLRDTGTGCFFGIPGDQCPGSALLAALASAPPSSVPILNLSSKSAVLSGVDCLKVYSGMAHNTFQTDPGVQTVAQNWSGISPCK